VRAALCVAIAGLALAGCNAILGIEEYRLAPDSGPPLDGPPLDGLPLDGPPLDGPPLDGPPLDGPPSQLYLGYPDDLGDTFPIDGNSLWAIDIDLDQEVTVDRLGFLSRSTPGAVATLALYADDGAMPGRPGSLVVQVQGVAVQEGACEGDVANTLLLPGTYWFALVADAGVQLGHGLPAVTHYFAYYDYTDPLPATFPTVGVNSGQDEALNMYLVVEP
jgi:hypothetical protein